MSLSLQTVEIVKSTIPVISEHGEEVTSRMYEILFDKYPETRKLFRAFSNEQPKILAAAIAAYAANIDDLAAIRGNVEGMAFAHVRAGVQPEHYEMVGDAILSAMKDVLGDAATDEVLNAWKDAYGYLADILVNREQMLYAEKDAE